jgi:hypothetical protein
MMGKGGKGIENCVFFNESRDDDEDSEGSNSNQSDQSDSD